MIGDTEHFFVITINYSAIANYHNSLGHAPFSSFYSQLLLASTTASRVDGQSASMSWNKTPIWGLRPDFYYCQTVAGLLMWDALSDERTALASLTSWTNNTRKYNCKQVSILMNLTIKLYNTTHYLHTTDNECSENKSKTRNTLKKVR
jgi:hypothetical protein